MTITTPEKQYTPLQMSCARAREDLIHFSWMTMGGKYYPNWHHDTMAYELELVEQGITDRLMLLMPPRHGKSELASIRFPAWYLGRNPTKNIISTSYGKDLVTEFGQAARDLVKSPTFNLIFPEAHHDPNTSAVHAWNMLEGGKYRGSGINGAITGKGANIFMIDDPIKNQMDAESKTYRERNWSWYRSVAYTRLEGNAAIVLIYTPWHKDDLGGRLLKAMRDGTGDKWRVVRFPAIAVEDEQMRLKGEALWPQKFNEASLGRIKKVTGPRYFQAMYQQKPTDEEGGIFKRQWWGTYQEISKFRTYILQAWDTAFEAKTINDYSCCETWIVTEKGFCLADVWRDRVEYPELKKKATALYDKWKPNVILVEKKASGHSLIQDMKRMKIPVVAVEADTDKVARATAVSPQVQAGSCLLPERAPWMDDFLDEHADFPNAPNDDQVDCTAHALKWLGVGAGVWDGEMSTAASVAANPDYDVED